MNLNQVTVPSTNVPRSIAFYKLLGLKLIVHSNNDYARFETPIRTSTFSVHKVSHIPLQEGVIVYFETEILDKEHKRLTSLGLDFDLPPTDQDWLWREAHVRDPDGNKIILFTAGENRKNPPWRLTD